MLAAWSEIGVTYSFKTPQSSDLGGYTKIPYCVQAENCVSSPATEDSNVVAQKIIYRHQTFFLNTLTVELDIFGSEKFDTYFRHFLETVEQTVESWVSGFG